MDRWENSSSFKNSKFMGWEYF